MAWQQAGLPRLRVSVNISPVQWRQADLAQQVQRVLIETGADPANLAIELSEDSVMADVARSTQTLRELKALDIEIAIDDFGTGSSGLGALQRLPVDVIKVDRSFVQDVTASPESVSVTRAIITMAHGMQLRVLAEGVETEGQLGLLAANGCDLVQGNWLSPPVSPEQMATLLREATMLPARFLRRREQQRTLLLVDDEENILAALKRLLRRDGYRIVTAHSGDEALQRLAEERVGVIVSDQRMPGMSGVEFLRRAKVLYPDTVRMTLSGFTDLQSIIDAVNEGAIYKFLTKPWDDELLRQHVLEAFRQKELDDENKRLSMEVAHANAELEAASTRLAGLLEVQREQTAWLAASASGAHEMLDELPVAVLGVDPDGLVAYANRAAFSLLPQAQAALGSVADAVFPMLLGCSLPADGPPVPLQIGGRGYHALSHRIEPSASVPQGRGRLVLLISGACEEAA
jgi:FixJ family two-component response regulator